MTRQNFAIEFVIHPLASQENGREYVQVSRVQPIALLERMVAVNFYRLTGGFCIIMDGYVWNASQRQPYHPEKVDCIVDDVGDALVFFESVTGQAEDGIPLRIYHTEMTTIEIRPAPDGSLLISGEAIIGPLRLPEIAVPASVFYGELHQAACDFIAFVKDLFTALHAIDAPGSKDEWQQLEKRLRLEQWEQTAERLRSVISRY